MYSYFLLSRFLFLKKGGFIVAKTVYKKKIKCGKEYYFYRLRHENSLKPKDIYGKTIKELEEKIKKIENELDNNISSTKLTLGALIEKWLFDVHANTIKSTTMQRYYTVYKNYIKDSPIYDIKVQKIKAMDIQEYYNALFKKGKSSSIINYINLIIAPTIRYAFNNDIIIKDFSRSLIVPKDKNTVDNKNKIVPFTIEEQEAFIKAIRGNELEVLFITALNTGMRIGELLALTWKDIKDNTITVNKTLVSDRDVSKDGISTIGAATNAPKTENSNRTISIPVKLSKLLKQHKLKQLDNELIGTKYHQNNDLVFCTQYGKYLNGDITRRKFQQILKDNDIKPRKLHDLRHTYATRLFEAGVNPKVVQTMLGHSSVSMTLDIYTHVLDNLKDKAMDKLEELSSSMGL